MAEVMSEELGLRILSAVQELRGRPETRVEQLEARLERLESRLDQLEEENRHLKKRAGVTANTVVLLAAVLRRPIGISVELSTRLGELQAS